MSREERVSPLVSSRTATRARSGDVKPNAAKRASVAPGLVSSGSAANASSSGLK